MSEIIYGLYVQIINGIINENLNKVDQQLHIKDTRPLDSVESSKILAEYLTKILREIFDYIEDGISVVRDRVNLCNEYKPKVLLRLTATSERADGRSIYAYFQGRVAAEILLWEAIERKLLGPFHYFG